MGPARVWNTVFGRRGGSRNEFITSEANAPSCDFIRLHGLPGRPATGVRQRNHAPERLSVDRD